MTPFNWREKIRYLVPIFFLTIFSSAPAFAEEASVQVSTDKSQIQLIGSETGDQEDLKITLIAPEPGTLRIGVDDLAVFEGGFASAPFGSQKESLSDYIFISETEFTYQPVSTPQDFVTTISIRSGLDQNRFARLLITFQPSQTDSAPYLLPLSVVATVDKKSLPKNVLIDPASEIINFKIKEENSNSKIKKFIPAIPKIIDSEALRLVSKFEYSGENMAWGQVAYEYQNSLKKIAVNELPGSFLLSNQSQESTLSTTEIKAAGIDEIPKVGLIRINAYLIDPATGQIIENSIKSNWALAFPWKLPFISFVLILILIAIWYNLFRKKQSKPEIKQEKIVSKPLESRKEKKTSNEFLSPFEFLIYLIASTADDQLLAKEVARDIYTKYKTPKLVARASLKSLRDLFAPTGLADYKAESLKNLAKYLVEQHDGGVPLDADALNRLPGLISADTLQILDKTWSK